MGKKIDSCTNEFINLLCWKSKPLISPSEILSNKWLNWCRNCSVPIQEEITCFSSWISPFSHKKQTRALLSRLLPYKTVSHFNPCPRILNRATLLMTFLLRRCLPLKTMGVRCGNQNCRVLCGRDRLNRGDKFNRGGFLYAPWLMWAQIAKLQFLHECCWKTTWAHLLSLLWREPHFLPQILHTRSPTAPIWHIFNSIEALIEKISLQQK